MGKGQEVAKERRTKFAQGIAVGLSQREAAKAAGYKGSDKTLDVQGSKLAKHPDVVAHLAKLREQSDAKAVATREELLEGLTADWRRDLGPYMRFDEAGAYVGLDLKKLREDGKAHWIEEIEAVEAVGGMKITGDGDVENALPAKKVKVKFSSRHGAADRIAKLLGLNAPKKIEATVQQNLAGLSDEELKARVKERLKKLGKI